MAHYNLSISLASLGRHQESVDHLRQAVRIKPDHARAHYRLGSALAVLGLTDEAYDHLLEAARLRPDWADPAERARELREQMEVVVEAEVGDG